MTIAGYDPFTLPPADQEGESRFFRSESPGGWPVSADLNTARVWLTAAAGLATRAEPMPPSARTVALKRVGRTTAGEYVLLDRGEVTCEPKLKPHIPSKIPKLKPGERAGAFLDSFVLREPGGVYERAVDSQVWRALFEWAEATRPSPDACRTASDAVALAVLVRHGVTVELWELPA